jgi:hypothetical protein
MLVNNQPTSGVATIRRTSRRGRRRGGKRRRRMRMITRGPKLKRI